jgi:hypothetical protein
MITDVSLRLLYLIFDRLLGWPTLLGRASSSKDVELWKLGHLGPTLAVQFASVWVPETRFTAADLLLRR